MVTFGESTGVKKGQKMDAKRSCRQVGPRQNNHIKVGKTRWFRARHRHHR